MKILLVSPCRDINDRKPKSVMIPQLAMHLIAGLTPPEHKVKIIEEEIDDINIEEDCDLVGISCMTANAPRAYHLAREFKKRGKKVVMGGVHPTILPDEAIQSCDSVVIGEVEGVWEQVLEDYKYDRLQKFYHKPHPSLETYVRIPHRKDTRKRLFNIIPIMTTRGCPYNCDFCCVHDIYGRRVRHIPVQNVVQDIIDSGGKFFIFLDDNIIGDPRYAKELFGAIKPLHIKWVGQASISFVKDTELMKMARESGCRGLFFGLESVSKSQLQKMRKSIKDIEKLEEAIKKVKSFGIFFHTSMIFGFDDDTKDIFPETLEFIHRNKISSATLNVLTPYPGTGTYQKFKNDGRLLTHDWKHYNHKTVVFKPKNMTPFELQAGRLWVFHEMTKFSSVMSRTPYNLDHLLGHLALNIGHRKVCQRDYMDLPKIAAQLFPTPDARVPYRKYFSLSNFRFTDFFLRNE